MKTRTFTFDITISHTFTIDELWPDGDAPENPTTRNVYDLVEQCGGLARVINDWDLVDDADLHVTDDVEWRQKCSDQLSLLAMIKKKEETK